MTINATKYKEEGARLQQARKSLGLTQSALAKEIGSSLAAVKAYERGMSRPSRRYAAALATAGINLGYIFSAEQPMLIPLSHRGAHAAMAQRVLLEPGADYRVGPARQGIDEGEAQRLRDSTQSLLKICRALRYEPPMVWTALIQELMIIHGLSDEGARRIIETLSDGVRNADLTKGEKHENGM
jgi:transcriptional regulator with XRE-family HTH domain